MDEEGLCGIRKMKWLKYSGLWGGFILNPYHWSGDILKLHINDNDYAFYCAINLGPVWVKLIIDDGRW